MIRVSEGLRLEAYIKRSQQERDQLLVVSSVVQFDFLTVRVFLIATGDFSQQTVVLILELSLSDDILNEIFQYLVSLISLIDYLDLLLSKPVVCEDPSVLNVRKTDQTSVTPGGGQVSQGENYTAQHFTSFLQLGLGGVHCFSNNYIILRVFIS